MEPMPGEATRQVDQIRRDHTDVEWELACFVDRLFQRTFTHSMRLAQLDHTLQPCTFQQDPHLRLVPKKFDPSQDRAYLSA